MIDTYCSKELCKKLNVYLIENDKDYAIVRCYLSDLEHIKEILKRENITIRSISGTLKSLRERL
ncbi:MAG: hypothetical protein QXT32_06205 [Candidatus Nitrosocaldaceae archaeon]